MRVPGPAGHQGRTMVRTAPHLHLLPACLLAVAMAAGCSDSVDYGERWGSSPETELTSGPVESDTTTFRVHFYWTGSDKDGEVIRYRFAVDADTTQPIAQWQTTTATDTILTFPVDPITAVRAHLFMVASEDNDGRIDPTPARRLFSSSTVRPTSCITRGPAPFNPLVPPTFTFEWTGEDPDGGSSATGGDVESFEYLLLGVGTKVDPADLSHDPLPPYNQIGYINLINQAVGDALPSPHDDWKWIGVQGRSQRFVNMSPGQYVFALRAVDEAGARESALELGCNIRFFTVSPRVAPRLTICSSVSALCFGPFSGPDITRASTTEILEGQTVSFSWSAFVDFYGGLIAGYSYALDDTTTFTPLDPAGTGVTLLPDRLPDGMHFLYVRVVDDEGLVTNAMVPILVMRAAFQDPGHGRSILYVDDSTAPGVMSPSQDQFVSFGNFPNDAVETEWWTMELLNALGVPVTEWDATLAGASELLGRRPPPLRTLANYSTVIWNVDHQNSPSSPTALSRTLLEEGSLHSYLAAGGTLILTGTDVSSNTVLPNTIFDVPSIRLCESFEPGTPNYSFTYVPRSLMGVDRAVTSKAALRRDGARDFIAAYATPAGLALGFDSALLDRGPPGSDAKWITDSPGEREASLAPGVGRVDGWVLAENFGCAVNPAAFRIEDPNRPIAESILRYHGVEKGVNEDGGPSPREGLVVGIRVQAHDHGQHASPTYGGELGNLTPGNARGAYGRMVHFSFPFFWLRDEDAIQAMQAAFQYVNASPTLP
jgi:hypothetical protein